MLVLTKDCRLRFKSLCNSYLLHFTFLAMRIQLMIALNGSPIYTCLPVSWQTRYSRCIFFFEHFGLVYTAAFPSYIFVGTARHDTAQACRRTRGVESIVGSLASTKRTCQDTKRPAVRACTCRATALSECSPIKSPTSSWRWDTTDRKTQPTRGRAC